MNIDATSISPVNPAAPMNIDATSSISPVAQVNIDALSTISTVAQVNDVHTSTTPKGKGRNGGNTGKKRKKRNLSRNAKAESVFLGTNVIRSAEEVLNRINMNLACGCKLETYETVEDDGNCLFRSIWKCLSKIMEDAGEGEIALDWCLDGTEKLNSTEKEIEAAALLRWTMYDIATRLLPFKVRMNH